MPQKIFAHSRLNSMVLVQRYLKQGGSVKKIVKNMKYHGEG